MWDSPLFWIVFAIGVFWALGAYNRLTRLRSAIIQAFGGVDAHLMRLVALLADIEAAERTGTSPARAALQAAAPQLSASLALARARPLDAQALAALGAARAAVDAAWSASAQTLHEPGHSEALAPFLERWKELSAALAQSVSVLNVAVEYHNAAIAQFPALLLARTFGFRPARGL